MNKLLKRRANLIYRLRRHGVMVHTKQRVIFMPYGDSGVWKYPQVERLQLEYAFLIQLVIPTTNVTNSNIN
jgi:hypothetical protein